MMLGVAFVDSALRVVHPDDLHECAANFVAALRLWSLNFVERRPWSLNLVERRPFRDQPGLGIDPQEQRVRVLQSGVEFLQAEMIKLGYVALAELRFDVADVRNGIAVLRLHVEPYAGPRGRALLGEIDTALAAAGVVDDIAQAFGP